MPARRAAQGAGPSHPGLMNQPATDHAFDLDGGRVCLDFANTLSSSSGEHLNSYRDLLAFARQANLLTRSETNRLHSVGVMDPHGAADVLARAKRLRAALRSIFSAVAANQDVDLKDLGVLNNELAIGLRHARVGPAGETGYGWEWGPPVDLDAPLWQIARSAADLLTSDEERLLVRQCGASDCQWLFVDTSKNRSRQWCSMSSCGNREKARRHYQRLRERRAASAPEPDAPAAHAGRRARRSAAARVGDASATAE